jgi:hypothetical protein
MRIIFPTGMVLPNRVIKLTSNFSTKIQEGKKLIRVPLMRKIPQMLILNTTLRHLVDHHQTKQNKVSIKQEVEQRVVAKIGGTINEVVFPHLLFKIQILVLIEAFVLKVVLILEIKSDLLQIRIRVPQIKIGFRDMEPLICMNNKIQKEELQEYLSLERTDRLPIPEQAHQGWRHSTQWYFTPQTFHLLLIESNKPLSRIFNKTLTYLNSGQVFKIPKQTGVNLQGLRIHVTSTFKGHLLPQGRLGLLVP